MSNLTRIKNNQITDSTIFANTKIAPGSIVGSLFSSNITVTSDFLITGNLTVLGASTTTTVASTNTFVNDPLIVMNNAFSGTNTYDLGLVFERGSDTNQAFVWDESADEFIFAATSESGTTYGGITVTNYANVHIGNATVQYDLGVRNVTASGDLAVNGGDLTTNQGTFNLLDTTATTINIGGDATTLELGAATGNLTVHNAILDTDGNVNIDGGALTTNGTDFDLLNATATTINFGGAATTIEIGAATGTTTINNAELQIDGNATVSLDLAVNGGDLTTTATTFNLVNDTATTVNFAGGASAVAIGAATSNVTIGDGLVVTDTLWGTTAYLSDVYNSNLTSGRVTFATTGGQLTDDGNFTYATDVLTVANISIDGTAGTVTIATSGDDDLILDPGLGVVDFNGAPATNLADPTLASDAVTLGYLETSLSSEVTNIGADDTIIQVVDDGIDDGFAYVEIDATEVANINATTGSLYSDSIFIDTDNSNVAISNGADLYVGVDAAIWGTTDATSTTTGALTVAGGVGIEGNLWVGGDLHVANLIAQNDITLTIQDPLLYLTANVTYPYNYDIGFHSQWTGGVGNIYQHGGFVRDAGDEKWKLFSNVVPEIGATVDFTDAKFDTLVIGNLEVTTETALVTTQTTADVFNTTATTVNAFGAATTLELGAATGTTSVNNNLDVDGDINVDGGDLTTNQTTFNLLDTNATTVNFAGAGTTIDIGAATGTTTVKNDLVVDGTGDVTGNLNVDGGALTTNETDFDLLDTNATTVNAFGAATTLDLGAGSGTTTVKNDLQVDGTLDVTGATNLNDTTDSTSSTTGALIVDGGVGVAQDLNVGGRANVTGITNLNSTATSTDYSEGALIVDGGVGVAGNLSVQLGQQITVGIEDPSANISFPERQGIFIANANVASGLNVKNLSTDTGASSHYFLIADDNSGETHFADFGLLNSGYVAPSGSAFTSGDAYLQSTGANLHISTTGSTNGDIIVTVGGGLESNVFMRYSQLNANVSIPLSTSSTSTGTGAFTVTGGVGIGEFLHVGDGAGINLTKEATGHFTVKGQFSDTLIYANAGDNLVVIGGGNTTPVGGATLRVNSTDSLLVPVGSTAERPGNSGNVDVQGMMRFNNSINNMEFYNGSEWTAVGSVFTVITDRQYDGDTIYGNVDGTNDTFTIQSNTATTAGTVVSINGVLQFPVLAYEISGNQLTFTEPPALGDVIDVRVLTTTATVDQVASGNGYNRFVADADGASMYSGTSASVKRLNLDPAGTFDFLDGTSTTYDQTAVTEGGSATTISSFSATTYRSAELLITAESDAGTEWEVAKMLVIHDGTTAYRTLYGVMGTDEGNLSVTYTATLSGGNVLVQAESTPSGAKFKVKETLMKD